MKCPPYKTNIFSTISNNRYFMMLNCTKTNAKQLIIKHLDSSVDTESCIQFGSTDQS